MASSSTATARSSSAKRSRIVLCASTRRVTPVAGGLTQPVDVGRTRDGSLFVAAAEGIVRIESTGGIANVTPALRPNSVAVDAAGLVYFTELRRPRVRRLDPATGIVTTVLGRDT